MTNVLRDAYIITGGLGFIGRHVCEKILTTTDAKVVAIDSLEDFPYPSNKKNSNFVQLASLSDNFIYVNGKIGLTGSVNMLLEKISSEHKITRENSYRIHIIHLAAHANVRLSVNHVDRYFNNNIKSTLDALRLAKKIDAFSFVFASSSSIFGGHKDSVMADTAEFMPTSPYANSKIVCENLIENFDTSARKSIVRLWTVIGEGQRDDLLIPKLLQSVIQDKEFEMDSVHADPHKITRSFTDVEVIADKLISIANSKWKDRETCKHINLCHDETISMFDVIGIVEKVTSTKVKIRRSVHAGSGADFTTNSATTVCEESEGIVVTKKRMLHIIRKMYNTMLNELYVT